MDGPDRRHVVEGGAKSKGGPGCQGEVEGWVGGRRWAGGRRR